MGKLIIILCRGGMDGLAAVTRPDDKHLRAAREELIPDNSLPAADGFAFDPGLDVAHKWFTEGSLSFMHAARMPWLTRSHFDAQDHLEKGTDDAAVRTGWLARVLNLKGGAVQAMAASSTLPLILSGTDHAITWSRAMIPALSDSVLTALKTQLYAADPALQSAMDQLAPIERLVPRAHDDTRRVDAQAEADPFTLTGQMLASTGGPDVGVISVGGWDTHDNQTGRLRKQFLTLNRGMADLRDALGPTWDQTAIVITSEFGRTIALNGTRGTDHGTGGLVMMAGGAVPGGRIFGDWPGLAPKQLYEGRDLYPANDTRQLFSAVLQSQLGLTPDEISSNIFPGFGV